MRIILHITALVMFMLGTACQPDRVSTEPPAATVTIALTPAISSSPTQGGEVENNPSPTISSIPEVQPLIEMAKADLSQRLSAPVSQIKLVEATEVEWSDSSLGCPQPGMDYLQVITPGYRILLEAGGQTYEYHSSRRSYVVFCENVDLPISRKP